MKYDTFSGPWPWKNFQPAEVACKHCGELWEGDTMPEDFRKSMDALQKLRDSWGKPLALTSGHCCREHNKAVGGVGTSRHLLSPLTACARRWSRKPLCAQPVQLASPA